MAARFASYPAARAAYTLMQPRETGAVSPYITTTCFAYAVGLRSPRLTQHQGRGMARTSPDTLRGTRGKILAQLCQASATAGELAKQLGISSNAIRMQLRELESHGLVVYGIERRGVGKPTHVYELSKDAGRLLSRAYIPVLHQLLSVWEEEQEAAQVLEGLQSVGRGLAADLPLAAGSLPRRVAAGVAAFEELGAIVRLEKGEDGGWTIQGTCCPLGFLTEQHPLLCKVMESMLARITRVRVRERCERGGRPHCIFDVRASGNGRRGRSPIKG